jgi:hypothetical protein
VVKFRKGKAGPFRPTQTQLEDGSRHLAYELEQLVDAATRLPWAMDLVVDRALFESFAIHARCVAEFFLHSDDQDLRPSHYVDDFVGWRRGNPPAPVLDDLRIRVGKLIHLTEERIASTEAEREPVATALDEAMRLLGNFRAHINEARVAPDFRARADRLLTPAATAETGSTGKSRRGAKINAASPPPVHSTKTTNMVSATPSPQRSPRPRRPSTKS